MNVDFRFIFKGMRSALSARPSVVGSYFPLLGGTLLAFSNLNEERNSAIDMVPA